MDYSKNEYHAFRHGKLSHRTENYISQRRLYKFNSILNLSNFVDILEAGVGYGWNFKFHPNKIDGYDKINVLTNNNITYKDKDDLLPNHYDLIVCHHVLEHISDPIAFINFNLNLLKPNGELLIFVPIEVKSTWMPSNKDFDNHYYSWTPRQISNLIHDNIENANIVKVGFLRFGFDRRAGELSNIFGYSLTRFIHNLFLFIFPRFETYCLIKKVSF